VARLTHVAGACSSLTTTMLAEASSGASLPAGAVEREHDFGNVGWGGPCPPCE
jgi:hypothetical protein